MRRSLTAFLFISVIGMSSFAETLPVINTETLRGSRFKEALSAFFTSHPKATYKETIAFANRKLAELGIDFPFDIRASGEIKETKDDMVTFIELFTLPKVSFLVKIESDQQLCNTNDISLPVSQITEETITMIENDGKKRDIARDPNLSVFTVEVLNPDGKSVRAAVPIPQNIYWISPDVVLGPLNDGKGIRYAFSLEAPPTLPEWWTSLQKKNPTLGKFHLEMDITPSGMNFSDDEAKLVPWKGEWTTPPPDKEKRSTPVERFKEAPYPLRWDPTRCT